MAEKRSVPTSLGLLIGPAIAYLSFWIFKSDSHEFFQSLCFIGLFLAGQNLAKGGLSLSGVMFVLFMPALPFALYLNALATPQGHQLSAMMVISLWLFSAACGALLAGLSGFKGRAGSVKSESAHITQLLAIAIIAAVFISLTAFVF